MLARLWLDRFICRNNQKHQVNPADSGEHIAHEALVPGNVDKSQPQVLAVLAGKFEVSKSNVDRDAAALFFFKPVGINTGQSLD